MPLFFLFFTPILSHPHSFSSECLNSVPTSISFLLSLCLFQEKMSNTDGLLRPFVYQEVIEGYNEPVHTWEYLDNGKVTDFQYGLELECIRGRDLSCLNGFGTVRKSVRFKSNGNTIYPYRIYSTVCTPWCLSTTTTTRGTAASSPTSMPFLCSFCFMRHNIFFSRESYDYKLANAFHLAHEHGFKRVMSSYSFTDPDAGPPSEGPPSLLTEGVAGNGWECEHRWSTIMNMVQVNGDDLLLFYR